MTQSSDIASPGERQGETPPAGHGGIPGGWGRFALDALGAARYWAANN